MLTLEERRESVRTWLQGLCVEYFKTHGNLGGARLEADCVYEPTGEKFTVVYRHPKDGSDSTSG